MKPGKMKDRDRLYLLQFDGEHYYVEAATVADAIYAWMVHQRKEWGKDWDGTEEPDSVALVHERPVIRRGNRLAKEAGQKGGDQ